MNSHILSWLPILLSFIILSLFLQFPLSSSTNPDQSLYRDCGSTFNCGSITGLDYPFRGEDEPEYCGYPGFVLNCQNNIATFYINHLKFRVLSIDQAAQTMRIAREDVIEATCPQDLVNTTLDDTPFEYVSSGYRNLSFLYGCPAPVGLILGIIKLVTCNISGYNSVYLLPETPIPLGCDVSVTVPVDDWVGSLIPQEWEQAIQGGFKVRWKVDSRVCMDCSGSQGRCGYNLATKQSTCYCPDPPYVSDTCSTTAGAGLRSTPTLAQSFTCGNIQNIMYPFWGANRADYCGLPGFELDCENNIPTITMASEKYRILQINTQQRAITVARDDLWNGMCPAGLVNTTLNFELFRYDFGLRNLTLFYGCNFPSGNVPWSTSQYNCSTNGTNVSVYCVSRSSASGPYYQNCNGSIVVPVFESTAQALDANMTTVGGAVDAGFELFWSPVNDQCITCMESGGVCGYNWKQSEFTCFCYDQPNQDACPTRPAIDQQYANCNQPFHCGNIPNIGYPFWGGSRPEYCGHPSFSLNCQADVPLKITIQARDYLVLAIDNTAQTLTVVRAEFWNNICPTTHPDNATLDTSHFNYSSNSDDLTLYYGCPVIVGTFKFPNWFGCDGGNTASYYLTSSLVPGFNINFGACITSVVVRVNRTVSLFLSNTVPLISVEAAVDSGFGLMWKANDSECRRCVGSGGICGSDSGSFTCYCSDQPYAATCNPTRNRPE
ncbi:unnamed protein product [Camellia sinensis]